MLACSLFLSFCGESSDRENKSDEYVLVGSHKDDRGTTLTFYSPDTNWTHMKKHANAVLRNNLGPMSSVSYYCSKDKTPSVNKDHSIKGKNAFNYLVGYYKFDPIRNKWVFKKWRSNLKNCH